MDLSKAFRVRGGESLAFVGAGGKTSLMFALAKEIGRPVVLTTTTHLGVWQAEMAERHHTVTTRDAITAIEFSNAAIHLLTGLAGPDQRLSGLASDLLDFLFEQCKQLDLPLLIEADGARQRPLKAPADYEPVIPDWIDRVVVLAGMSGVGQPLTEASVHRPDTFGAISGKALGTTIQPEDLITVLGSEKGGLQGIPEGARRDLFLNQADDERSSAIGGRIARQMTSVYDRVMIGSLHQPEPNKVVSSVHAKTAGIVLAAGGSDRLGSPKQLLLWQGKPFIRKVVENGLEAGLSPLVVVTGAFRDDIMAALNGLSVHWVHNVDWQSGQASSVRAGLLMLSARCDSAMFLLSDQPQISAGLIRQLLERYAQNRMPITAPLIEGRRGNPVLFKKETFEALFKVSGDQGGRAVFSQFPVDWLNWVDRRYTFDVDQKGDEMRINQAFFIKEKSKPS